MRERPSSRLLILDPESRVLLFHFRFTTRAGVEKVFWATPGGGLERGETFHAAAARELGEETGIVADIGAEVARRDSVYELPDGETVSAHERFFLVRVTATAVSTTGQSRLEQRVICSHRWWALDELAKTDERVYPADIGELVRHQAD